MTRKIRKWRRKSRERRKRKMKRTYKVSEGINALNKYMKCGE